MTDSHRIFHTELDDGSIIAVSIDSPRFCVGAQTKDEVLSKATRALAYFDSIRNRLRTPSREETRVISPSFKEEQLCA
jgi:hypothetical protein